MRPYFMVSALLSALAAGCAPQAASLVPASDQPSPSSQHLVSVRVTIPAIAANMSSRRLQYVSRNTQGIGISFGASPATFPNATTPVQSFDVSAASTLCASGSNGARTCTLAIAAPSGSDDFQVTAWDQTPSGGSFSSAHRLSGTTVLGQTVAPGQTNALNFTLNGAVDSIYLTVSPSSLIGAATPANGGPVETATLSVNAKDLYGNIILGSGSYTDAGGNPLTIAVTQSPIVIGDQVKTSLSATNVTQAGETITVTYNGNSSYGTAFTATPSRAISGTIATAALLAITPNVTEFRNISGGAHPEKIVNGPDGNLWFCENGLDSIGQITPADVVTEFSSGITPNSGLFGIAVGPDNNLWFTENSRGIGKITTGGMVTEYAASGGPTNIVNAGGKLWFTLGTAKIGNITTDGVLSEIASGIPSGNGLTNGPDGNLWLTDYNSILEEFNLSTNSGIQYTSGLSASSGPNDITTGSDANLWFTEQTGSRIGRITTSGSITEYTIAGSLTPNAITSGPDGNLWFTLQQDKIGRISTGGVIALFSTGITSGAAPYGITTGSDGNIWFTENNLGIARLIY